MKSVMRIAVFTALYLSIGVLQASAQQNRGRLEIAITSGDTDLQLSEVGQTTFSLYLLNTGGQPTGPSGTLSGINSWVDTNTTGAEIDCCDDIVSGSLSHPNKFSMTITGVASASQPAWSYVFTGTYNDAPSDSSSSVITGTYTTTGYATSFSTGGTFTATFFPDFPSTPTEYIGGLSGPDVGSGPVDVPTTLYLGTNSAHELTGSVTTSLTNSAGVSCFAGPLTIAPGAPPSESYASGVLMEVYANDKDGNQLWLIGYSAAPNGDPAAVGENGLDNEEDSGTQVSRPNDVNNGTNNELIFYYWVLSGPCQGLGGPDAPFHKVTKPAKHERRGHDRMK
jgi:hypothetical protein